MTHKSTFRRILGLTLFSVLAACGTYNTTTPTEASFSTAAVSTPTIPSPTMTLSPVPTRLIVPIVTPDEIQVARWKEYEEALAKAFFNYIPSEEVVCEWEILGQSEQEVYVYAYCATIYSSGFSQGDIPAVIHIRADGSVIDAEIPGAGSSYASDIRRMFPPEAQERIFVQPSEYFGTDAYWGDIERSDRLRWRRGHPDDPPWIILKALLATPTPLAIPLIVPDKEQTQKWNEYQTALGDAFFGSYESEKPSICEWEILAQGENKVYVWAICGKGGGGGLSEGLAIIHIRDDGTVNQAETTGIGGMGFPSEIREMFPREVQERYFGGLIHFQELVDHLRSRLYYFEKKEPPLIVLWATQTP